MSTGEPTNITQAKTPVVAAFGYFTIVPDDLMESDLSDRAVRLWGRLYRKSDRERHEAKVTRGEMAEWLKVSRDTVDRALRELEDAGWLQVERDITKSRTEHLPSAYRLTSPSTSGISGGSAPVPTPPGPADDDPEAGRKGAASPGRTDAPSLAAPVRHKDLQEVRTERRSKDMGAADAAPVSGQDSSDLVLLDAPAVEAADPVLEIWSAYQDARKANRPTTRPSTLTPERRRLIQRRLRTHGREMVLDAVRGWLHDPWARGDNPQGKAYGADDPSYVLRVEGGKDHVERFAHLEADAREGTLPSTPISPKAAAAERRARLMAQAAGESLQLGAGGAA